MRTTNPPPSNIEQFEKLVALDMTSWRVQIVLMFIIIVAFTILSFILFHTGYFNSIPIIASGLLLCISGFLLLGELICKELYGHGWLYFYVARRYLYLKRPVIVVTRQQEFQTYLKSKQAIIVNLVIAIAEDSDTDINKERVKTTILAAMGKGCESLDQLPTFDAIIQMVDGPITKLSEEQAIPLLYVEIVSCTTAERALESGATIGEILI